MTTPIAIKITEEHIRNGIPGKCNDCPIALAVKEQVPNINPISVQVDEDVRFETLDGRSFAFCGIDEVCDFISQYDDACTRKECKPFELYLDLEAGEYQDEYESDCDCDDCEDSESDDA